MTFPDGYRLIPLPQSRHADLLDLDSWSFPTPHSVEDLLKLPSPLSWDRTVAVVSEEPDAQAVPIDGAVPVTETVVAIHSSYPFSQFPVPGAQIPVGGLTWVGVHPQHRRKGILSAMIDAHFQHCIDRGEAVSALFAAEAGIYSRFGYGQAANDLRVTIPRRAPLRPVEGSGDLTLRLEKYDAARHSDLVAAVHAEAGRHPSPASGVNRPGWATRETAELRATYDDDPAMFRDGRESRRIAIVESDGEPRGYATFRRKVDWQVRGPRGTVAAGEVVALDAAAAHRLWSTLLDLDLSDELEPFLLPTDDAIMSLLIDPRSAQPRIADNVWVRIIDIAAALSARQYATDIDVVLQVSDERLPANAGTWHLRGSAFGAAAATPTTRSPDLSLSIAELSRVYLGGFSLASLAAAGLVTEHTEGALAAASAAFGWPVAPACSWVF